MHMVSNPGNTRAGASGFVQSEKLSRQLMSSREIAETNIGASL